MTSFFLGRTNVPQSHSSTSSSPPQETTRRKTKSSKRSKPPIPPRQSSLSWSEKSSSRSSSSTSTTKHSQRYRLITYQHHRPKSHHSSSRDQQPTLSSKPSFVSIRTPLVQVFPEAPRSSSSRPSSKHSSRSHSRHSAITSRGTPQEPASYYYPPPESKMSSPSAPVHTDGSGKSLPMPGLSGRANGPVGNLLKGPVDEHGRLKDAALMVGIKLDLEAEVHLTARVRGDILVGLY